MRICDLQRAPRRRGGGRGECAPAEQRGHETAGAGTLGAASRPVAGEHPVRRGGARVGSFGIRAAKVHVRPRAMSAIIYGVVAARARASPGACGLVVASRAGGEQQAKIRAARRAASWGELAPRARMRRVSATAIPPPPQVDRSQRRRDPRSATTVGMMYASAVAPSIGLGAPSPRRTERAIDCRTVGWGSRRLLTREFRDEQRIGMAIASGAGPGAGGGTRAVQR